MNTVVEVKNIHKSYGSVPVLKNLNMTVQCGTIYGLLGASGCGKTTLLSCIIGMTPSDSGVIRMLGERIVNNVIPSVSSRIGYLPQETALIRELTVRETLYFFGNIYQYERDKLDERYQMLHNLLELPPDDRRVVNCSGGQQRRVSFASALMHEPNLLILDEPTVGLDPILRDKTWNFLKDISRNQNKTVIITTHYIEEARQADRCGLMRNGILLDEGPPQEIIMRHHCGNLEEAFLKLCVRQGSSDYVEKLEKMQKKQELEPIEEQELKIIENSLETFNFKKRRFFCSQTITALIRKNFTMIIRQPFGLVNLLVLNIVNILFFYLAIGGNPKGLKLAIVDDEIANFKFCQNSSLITTFAHNYTCDLHKISCRFLDGIPDEFYDKIFYENFDDAYKDALDGKLYAVIHIGRNFTESTQEVWRGDLDEYSPVYDHASIDVHMDKTDFQLRVFFENQMRSTYDTYSRELLRDCGYAAKLDSVAVQMEKPIYGKLTADFKLMLAPIIIMLMMYFQSMISNVTIITDDRSNGFWNRTLLSGVAKSEYLFCHSFVMSIFNMIQLLEIVGFLKIVLKTDDIGKIVLITVFLLVLSFAGMFTAFIVGCAMESQEASYYLMNSIGVVTVTLSGVMWPVEAMPRLIQYIVYAFPIYIPASSANDIIAKGFGIFHYSVYMGLFYVTGWTVVAAFLTFLILKSKGFSRNA